MDEDPASEVEEEYPVRCGFYYPGTILMLQPTKESKHQVKVQMKLTNEWDAFRSRVHVINLPIKMVPPPKMPLKIPVKLKRPPNWQYPPRARPKPGDIMATCLWDEIEWKNIRKLEMVYYEGTDPTGARWFLIHEPPGLTANEIFALLDPRARPSDEIDPDLVAAWKKYKKEKAPSSPVRRYTPDHTLITRLNTAASVERLRLAETFGLLQVEHTPKPGERRHGEFHAYQFELTWDRRGNFELRAHNIDWLQMIDIPLPLSEERKEAIRRAPHYMKGGVLMLGVDSESDEE